MPRYAAFLRGINVGGTRIKADDLCKPFADLGYEEVGSFRASGNIVFDAPRTPSPKLAKQIEQRLDADLGFSRAITFIRTTAEMRALAADDPFGGRQSDGKLQVLLLLRKPSAAVQKQVLGLEVEGEAVAFGKSELFWLPRGRMIESDFDLKAVEKLIGPTTMRTKGTIEQMTAKFFA